MTAVVQYFTNKKLPLEEDEARKIRRLAAKYTLGADDKGYANASIPRRK